MPKTEEKRDVKDDILKSQKELIANIDELKKTIEDEINIEKNPQAIIGGLLVAGIAVGLLYKPVKSVIGKSVSGIITAYLVKTGINYLKKKVKSNK